MSSAHDLALEDLSQYFHLPIAEAAKEIGVCATVLKKICRKNNIPRWPHRKIKSINKMIAVLESSLGKNADDDARIRDEIKILIQHREFVMKNPDTLVKNYNKRKRDSKGSSGKKKHQEQMQTTASPQPKRTKVDEKNLTPEFVQQQMQAYNNGGYPEEYAINHNNSSVNSYTPFSMQQGNTTAPMSMEDWIRVQNQQHQQNTPANHSIPFHHGVTATHHPSQQPHYAGLYGGAPHQQPIQDHSNEHTQNNYGGYTSAYSAYNSGLQQQPHSMYQQQMQQQMQHQQQQQQQQEQNNKMDTSDSGAMIPYLIDNSVSILGHPLSTNMIPFSSNMGLPEWYHDEKDNYAAFQERMGLV